MTTATATKIFADRIERIEVSATMAITATAQKLKAEGVDLADFGAGEPHFSTPQHIKDAAIDAINKNFTRYTNVAGTPEVRKAHDQPTPKGGGVGIVVTFLVGIISILMGLLAEMIVRTYFESQQRTAYRVRDLLNL